MGLGATLKVAMDTTAVRRGLSSIRGMFGRLSSTLRGIGGAMRKSLVPVVGLLGGLGFAAKKVADFGSELSDMAVQTGVAVDRLVVLQEALRRAGAQGDLSRMLSTLASNLQEAFDNKSIQEALFNLQFRPHHFNNKSLEESFMMILKRIRDIGDESRTLERDVEQLFGARIGMQLLRFAKDFDANMQAAEKSAGSFATHMLANADRYDKLADSLGRFTNIFRQFIGEFLILLPLERISEFIESIQGGKIAGGIKDFFRDPMRMLKATWAFIAQQISELWERLIDMLTSKAEKIGTVIGAGITSALGINISGETSQTRGLAKAIEVFGAVLSLLGPKGLPPIEIKSEPGAQLLEGPVDMKNKKMEDSLQDINRHLERLNRQGGARFA